MKIVAEFLLPTWLVFLASCGCGELYLRGGNEDEDAADTSDRDPDAVNPDAVDVAEFSWNPGIDNLGEPGWRDSHEPWCGQVIYPQNYAFDVWSDAGGVYVLLRENPFWPDRAFTCPQDCPDGNDDIYVNRGSGWSVFWEQSHWFASYYGVETITGVPGSRLVTTDEIGTGNPIKFIENGSVTDQTGTEGAKEVFVVDENLAYTIIWEFRDEVSFDNVAYYNGSSWGPLPVDGPPYAVNHLWADAENLFLAGPQGTVLSLEGTDWKVHDTHTLMDVESVWGFGGSDVWAGAWEGQLLHYDGETWTLMEWPNLARSENSYDNAVKGMWGRDGVLFFHTSRQLVMWDGVSFTELLLAEDAGGTALFDIKAIWGNSPTEIFIAVDDRDQPRSSCGTYYLLWWDGSEFHWF